MVEATVQLGRYHARKAKKLQIEALKEAYEELKEMAKKISFPQ